MAKFVRGNVEQHLETMSETCRFNELQAWLDSLPEWDGEDQDFGGLFTDMYDAEDTDLNRWAANAVFWQVTDRIIEGQHGRRGTSHRATILFAGPQTCGKTAFVREMLPGHLRSRYLVEGLNFGMDRDAMVRACCGKLLVEVGRIRRRQGFGGDQEFHHVGDRHGESEVPRPLRHATILRDGRRIQPRERIAPGA